LKRGASASGMGSLTNWKKSPAALFQTVAALPPAKGVTFAGCAPA
jgi:hypothetical protein